MPTPFVDRSVSNPKRFAIVADGSGGTSNDPALNGKIIELDVNPGTIFEPGTALNAEELNKRIIGDNEDKTFTELRTLIDTLNIDKDQNASLVMRRLGMRTWYNSLINSGFLIDMSNWSALAGSIAVWDAGTAKQQSIASIGATFQEVEGAIGDVWFLRADITKNSGTQAAVYALPKGATSGALGNLLTDNEFDALADGETVRKSLLITLTNDGFRFVFGRISAQTFSLNIDNMLSIKVTDTELEGLTLSEIDGHFNNHFETKTITKNPQIETIGKNKLDPSAFEQGTLGSSGEDSSNTKRIRSDYTPIKPNTDYVNSIQVGTVIRVATYDSELNFIELVSTVTFTSDPNAKFIRVAIQLDGVTDITPNAVYTLKPQLELGTVPSDYLPYNSNEENIFRFYAEGGHVTDGSDIIDDSIELRNNVFNHIRRTSEEGVAFQAEGSDASNWIRNAIDENFTADFLSFGFEFDPFFVNLTMPFSRLIIDGKVYKRSALGASLDDNFFTFNSDKIIIKDSSFVSEVAFAFFIASATEVILDFAIPSSDYVTKEIKAIGFTVIEENGTVILINEDGVAFVVDSEIPVNIPEAIHKLQEEVRRLFNEKAQFILVEDYTDLALTIPPDIAGGEIEATDSYEYQAYIFQVASADSPAVVKSYLVNTIRTAASGATLPQEQLLLESDILTVRFFFDVIYREVDKAWFLKRAQESSVDGSGNKTTDDTVAGLLYAVWGVQNIDGGIDFL